MMKIYALFYRLGLSMLFIARLLNGKIKAGVKLRKKQNKIKPWLNFAAHSRPVWFHCASGEFEYAKPVIRAIKNQNPQTKILVTFFSPSVLNSLKSSPEIDFFCPTPWDTRTEWQEFIEHHQPQALLVARTDLWPQMLATSKKNNIPALLFSKTTKKRRGLLKRLSERWLLPYFKDVFCVSQEDIDNLQEGHKGFSHLHKSGDTRYDQCLYRIQNGKHLKPLKNFNRPVFIAGSTWLSDELVLLPTIKDMISEVSFIIAPHEPTKKHLGELIKNLEQRDIPFQLYSEIQDWNPLQVLIIDQVGILADLYSWGQFAFIGGSMDRSVHSVMEPLAQGLLCFVGPEHENNREALLFKQEKIQDMTPLQVITDSDLLLRRFRTLSTSWSAKHQMELKMRVREKSGASDIVLKWITNNI